MSDQSSDGVTGERVFLLQLLIDFSETNACGGKFRWVSDSIRQEDSNLDMTVAIHLLGNAWISQSPYLQYGISNTSCNRYGRAIFVSCFKY